MVTCRCGKSWSGLKMAHCSVCHETFSTPRNFDIHRSGGVCWYTPRAHGVAVVTHVQWHDLVQNNKGTWKMPDERDVSDLGLLRRSASRVSEVADDTLSGPES